MLISKGKKRNPLSSARKRVFLIHDFGTYPLREKGEMLSADFSFTIATLENIKNVKCQTRIYIHIKKKVLMRFIEYTIRSYIKQNIIIINIRDNGDINLKIKI